MIKCSMDKQRVANIQTRLEAGYTGDLGQYIGDTRADIRYLLAQLDEEISRRYQAECNYEHTIKSRDMLRTQLAEARLREWIETADRLPAKGDIVLTYTPAMRGTEAAVQINKGFSCYGKYITHWMPLPESPKEATDGQATP